LANPRAMRHNVRLVPFGTPARRAIGRAFHCAPPILPPSPPFVARHHFGAVFSAVVAGGGFRGGRALGASDAKGERVKDRPVYPWDLSASMYQLLGIDPGGRLPHPQGCVAYVTPLAKADVPTGGLLKEVM
jgi:hypothetical protein